MSVDPDDKTPLAIKNTGADIISYGAPDFARSNAFYLHIMKKGDQIIPIMGLSRMCYVFKENCFDLILPRIMADDKVSAEELAHLGEGGLCLGCKVCTYPNCGFGKGW